MSKVLFGEPEARAPEARELETRETETRETGQATVLMAGVLAVVVLLGIGLLTLANAMVHRDRARTAADAVALAATQDLATAEELAEWYQDRSIEVSYRDGYALAESGPSQAAAWAAPDGEYQAMPVLVAIVARVGQLVGGELSSTTVVADRVRAFGADAVHLRSFSSEFGLCEHVGEAPRPESAIFGLC